MRVFLLFLLSLSFYAEPCQALPEDSYDVEYGNLVEPTVRTESITVHEQAVIALLKFIDDPATTPRQKYLAWRRIGRLIAFNPGLIDETTRKRFHAQKP